MPSRASDRDGARASSETQGPDVAATAAATRVVDSKALLRNGASLAIRHRESIYYLRETRFGKLILTK
ncbi:MAG TPA: hemin uptake protein HemP [Casimicrobiaceae bacterium]|nr:hemin uptake protein HemP [Casimicrobiaceae bacterium]